jgi:peptide deformylase
MAIHKILYAPHPSLTKTAEPVDEINDEIRDLLDDMMETMYDAPGIGLAGPQIDVLKRVITIDLSGNGEYPDQPGPYKMVNPEIIGTSDDTVTREEGCLSLPGQFADITRPGEVTVRFLDEHGEQRELTADGLFAACIQHEIDHLNGVLFTDYLSAIKRSMLMRKLRKHLKREGLE